MTPSVSPQNAMIDCAIFAATVLAAVELSLRSVWRPPHGAIVVMAHCRAVRATKLCASRPIAAATRGRCYECGLALIADGHPHPVPPQLWNGHHLSLQKRRYSRSYRTAVANRLVFPASKSSDPKSAPHRQLPV